MEIKLNTINLIDNKLSPNEYTILNLIYLKKHSELINLVSNRQREYTRCIYSLCEKGWLKYSGATPNIDVHELFIRDKFKDILDDTITEKVIIKNNEIEEWIQSWRALFPAGKANGYPSRGDKKGCIKKMKTFIQKYPEYDKDIIFKATRAYILEKKKDEYRYLQGAHYFIDKNRTSNLAAFCELIVEGGEMEEKNNVINL